MDILSSQANLAVIKLLLSFQIANYTNDDDSSRYNTSNSIGGWCRCCWVTSNCNSKRMGAIVFATDVRMASKEQVESLGGKFLT